MKGGEQEFRFDTDHEKIFRQESSFSYLTGVEEPGCFLTIELETGKSVLFVPDLPMEYAVWMGVVYPKSYYEEKYGVEEVLFVDDIPAYFKEKNPNPIFINRGVNTDSGHTTMEATFDGIDQYKVDYERLFGDIGECRVIKTPQELEVMRYVAKISSEAHKQVMRKMQPGMMEYQLESLFLHECYARGGARCVAYTCICGAGHSGATLHYGRNNKRVEDDEMCLFDMGCEYQCYTSDITCSYPSNGKFSDKMKVIYNAVLACVKAVSKEVKPGAYWPDLHRLSERTMCEELKKAGLLQGDVDNMMKHFIGSSLQPHGLGHLMGLDVHDIGGYPGGAKRSAEPGLRNLRCGRHLEEGMVLTIEPGCYFVDAVLDPLLANPETARFFNQEMLATYRGFGGVRIE
ncbi:xaa-Pro dipeptidase, partial [Sphaeroforma arctica JP610]